MMWIKISLLALVLAIVLPVESVIDVCRTHDKILNAGFPAERYDVVTEDGYILEVNRIPRGRNQFGSDRRPVIFLMHGLSGCSSNFLELGANFAPGFNLADAGFDVWLGNARGVGMSRRHVKLNPDDRNEKKDFFDYSWEEIALYDLPAMINVALEKSGQNKLHYIGHSQGGTVFLVLNSMKPEFQSKFISAHLLAGVGYQNYFPNPEISKFSSFTDILYTLGTSMGLVELNGPTAQTAAARVGTADVSLYDVVNAFNNEAFAQLANSASLKQFAHYGQNINAKQFRRWDYSLIQNLSKYGTGTPPNYDLKNINVEIIMHYTIADELLDERDVLDMAKDLPKATARKVAKDDFSHVDFVASLHAKTLVTEYIIDDLRRR